jgi:xylulokinase
LNRWLKQSLFDAGLTYPEMNELASQAPIGSAGLVFIPYGNGAERTLENRDVGSSIHNLNFNIHDRRHILRAAQEGIVFALNYGVEIMRGMRLKVDVVRVGSANMFLSPLFREAFANTLPARLELYNTDGAQGAARGAGVGAGIYSMDNAFRGLEKVETVEPDESFCGQYKAAYESWLAILESLLE